MARSPAHVWVTQAGARRKHYYVQRQLGHSSIQVTCDIYGHLLDNRNPEAAAKTDRLVFGDRSSGEIRQGLKAETSRNSVRKAQARMKSASRS